MRARGSAISSRQRILVVATSMLSVAAASRVLAQCQVTNPSFERAGFGGSSVFAEWNELPPVAADGSLVAHGQVAARLSGPNVGDWSVSAVWQAVDCTPGELWTASVRVGHRSADPLTGDARGIVVIEWRDSGGGLIDSEVHEVLQPTDATDLMHRVSFESGPAPVGAAKAVFVVGMLQSPAQESGSVVIDHVQFRSQSPPTFNDIQWVDFPGGRTLTFAGRQWRVKGPGLYGPGPNLFSDSTSSVWVDELDRLHVTIQQIGGSWYSTEVTLEDSLGYGDYIYTTRGRQDTWAANVVFGLFTWQYPECWIQGTPWNLPAEFDVEVSRWGNPGDDVGQFVAQPYNYPGNIRRFAVPFTSDDQLTSYGVRILPHRVEARCWLGAAEDESPGTLIHAWTYAGPHVPLPEQPRVHINFWQFNGPPSNGADHEAVIESFRFVPACDDDPAGHALRCLTYCLEGPERAVLTSCGEFDGDGDGDVDLLDFGAYQSGIVAR